MNSQIIEVIVEGIKMGTSILLVIGITFGTIVVSFVLGARLSRT